MNLGRRHPLVKLMLIFFFLFAGSQAKAEDQTQYRIHGFISQGYVKSNYNNYLLDSKGGSFDFSEVGINVAARYDKLWIGLQVLSRDLGDQGNNNIVLDWGLGDYRFSDEFGIRVGKCKMPAGFYNQGRDIDMLHMPILLPMSVYDEGRRDFANAYSGVGIYGDVFLKSAGDFDYEVWVGSFDIDAKGHFVKGLVERVQNGFSLYVNQIGPDLLTALEKQENVPEGTFTALDVDVKLSDTKVLNRYVTGASLKWHPPGIEGLRFGTVVLTAPNNQAPSRLTISPQILLAQSAGGGVRAVDGVNGQFSDIVDLRYGIIFSAEFMYKNVTLTAEAIQIKLTHDTQILGLPDTPIYKSLNTHITQKTLSRGWYVQISGQITDWLGLCCYYSEYYPDIDDRGGNRFKMVGKPDYYAWQKEIVPTVRFDIQDHLTIKFETHFIDGAGHLLESINPDGMKDHWVMFLGKATFNF